jgi:hypothetical protein
MWRFSNRRRVTREGDFTLRQADKNHKLLQNFAGLVQQETQKSRSLQWKLLINGFYMDQWFSLSYSIVLVCGKTTYRCRNVSSKIETTLNHHSHMTSKGVDYFKRQLESQNKHSKSFCQQSHSQWKGSGRNLYSRRTYCSEYEKSHCW